MNSRIISHQQPNGGEIHLVSGDGIQSVQLIFIIRKTLSKPKIIFHMFLYSMKNGVIGVMRQQAF